MLGQNFFAHFAPIGLAPGFRRGPKLVGPKSQTLAVRSARRSVRIEPEILELSAPHGVGITQALDIDPARQVPLDGCFDELWGEKRERERQIDLTHGASLAPCQLLGGSD